VGKIDLYVLRDLFIFINRSAALYTFVLPCGVSELPLKLYGILSLN